MIDTDFTGSALIGHLIASSVLARLVINGIMSGEDAADLLDETLLKLEEWQGAFPENESAFVEARSFLDGLVKDYRKIGQ